MSRTTWLAAVLAGAALALSACGGEAAAPTPTTSGGSPLTSAPGTPTGSPEPTATPTQGDPPVSSPRPKFPPRVTRPPKPPTQAGPGARTTVTGTISEGVEGNCLLLNGYLLLGGPRNVLKPGARVTVAGRVQPGMITTCQQGTPLVVESAQPG
ncbi:hypothetical protein ACFFWC_06705 [Plantactinospora siamensis]|uniref:Uncharacterized protein n=1 Tax=Plantactinospora siamensis TaxID=555372 RepID=A0ABV6NWY7_9ACTN